MQDLSKEKYKEDVKQMLRSEGWKYLVEEINEELMALDLKANSSYSVEVGNICMQKRLGILYVINRAKDLSEA